MIISLTSNICYVLEAIIYNEIYEYFSIDNLLSTFQHSFRKRKSTLINLLGLFNDVTLKTDYGNNFDIVSVDFSKAFERLPNDKSL